MHIRGASPPGRARLLRALVLFMHGGLLVGCVVSFEPPDPAAAEATLALGDGHTCALEGGAVRCWGDNSVGQLGDGTATAHDGPVTVEVSEPVQIAAGRAHTCALTAGGEVFCWGESSYVRLGDPAASDPSGPVQAILPSAADAVVAAMGFTCVRLTDGRVQCFGYSANGQHGDGGTEDGADYVIGASEVLDLAMGSDHLCLLQPDRVSCAGSNFGGQLGRGAVSETSDSTPADVAFADGVRVTQLGAGLGHSCAVTARDELYCWGENEHGQLGTATPPDTVGTPTLVPGFPPAGEHIRRVDGGEALSCALLWPSGEVHCWGWDYDGRLGRGEQPATPTPGPVLFSGRPLTDVTELDVGHSHACARTADGTTYCWGRNAEDQIQRSDIDAYSSAVPLAP